MNCVKTLIIIHIEKLYETWHVTWLMVYIRECMIYKYIYIRTRILLTRNIPRFALVKVNIYHEKGIIVCDLLHQVITHKLFISWMEPEPWWQLCLYHAYVAHVLVWIQVWIEERERKRERWQKKRLKVEVRNLEKYNKGRRRRKEYI